MTMLKMHAVMAQRGMRCVHGKLCVVMCTSIHRCVLLIADTDMCGLMLLMADIVHFVHSNLKLHVDFHRTLKSFPETQANDIF